MSQPLALSLYPGLDLLGRQFEAEGWCVVRGPDLIWGGDSRRFHPPAGCWDGVFGGPPCQVHSKASVLSGTTAEDLIPDFVRIVQEARPQWVVMENVIRAMKHPAVPSDWFPCVLRDWDCGGETSRTRAFWTWPFALLQPTRRPGEPEHSVMATTWKRGSSQSKYVGDKGFLPGDLPLTEYGRLQGAGELAGILEAHHCSRAFAVHLLGNGVPAAMGRWIARSVREAMESVDAH